MKLFSLNLHGYHPMGERERWFEDRQGRIRRADTNLHLFTTQEMDRGSRKRLDRLATDLSRLAPDVICLQEVAAGCPWTPRNCEIFHKEFSKDWFESNTALRLASRLNAHLPESERYLPVLACRGNIGWITHPDVFERERVVTFHGVEQEIVFDFGENPYPNGILVEGFAILVKAPWRVLEHHPDNLLSNANGERFFAQRVVLQKGDGPAVVLANLHLGHKVRHFEQALAVRRALAELAERYALEGEPARVMVLGDFNASLHRPGASLGLSRPTDLGPIGRPTGPAGGTEPSSIPWEIHVPGQFDFRPGTGSLGELLELLWRLNDDEGYKPWTTIRDVDEANRRIRAAAEGLFAFQEKISPVTGGLIEAIELARAQNRVAGFPDLPTSATVPGRIDLAFVDPRVEVERACMVYPANNWASTAGTSDHPAVYVETRLV